MTEFPNAPAQALGGAPPSPNLPYVLQMMATLQGSAREAALTEHLRQDFHRLPAAERAEWLTALANELPMDMVELNWLARESFQSADLKGWLLRDLLARASEYGLTSEQMGSLMARWLDANGSKRFINNRQQLVIVIDGHDIIVGNNLRFNAFLLREASVTMKTKGVNKIVAAFSAAAAEGARMLPQLSWLHTDRNAQTVYLHLNAAEREIIRIRPTGVDHILNGSNDAGVLLTPSTAAQPWHLLPLSQVEQEDALRLIDKLILSRMACSRENQLLFGCWALSFPLMDFVLTRPHLRAEGSTSLGKSTGMDLVSMLVYGSSEKVITTSAFNYSDGAINPFLFLDNLERSGMKAAMEQYLALAATGGKKGKRIPGTVSATVREEIRCLVCSTGIENLGKGELINRTIHIEFDKTKYGSKAVTAPDLEAIKQQRSRLLSAHMQLVQRVLARIAAGEMAIWQNTLSSSHFLARANDFIAVLALIAEELLPVIEPQRTVNDLVQNWIDGQDIYGRQTTREASQLVTLAEALLVETDTYNAGLTRARWGYDVTILPSGELTGLSGEWLRAFSSLRAKRHLRFDLSDAGQLTRRLKDAQPALASAGIQLDWVFDSHAKVFRFTLGRAATPIVTVPAVSIGAARSDFPATRTPASETPEAA